MSISITRALAEIKSLDARIVKGVEQAQFSDLYQRKNMKTIATGVPVDEFQKSAVSEYQSIKDMIERRKTLKAAVINSNGKTMVVIGGLKMSVAEAIARKGSIESEKILLLKMKDTLAHKQNEIERQRPQLEDGVRKMLEANLGADKKATKDDYENIAQPFLEKNELVLCDPIGIKSEIGRLDKAVDGFISEVDFVLSESNSKTEIEV